MILPTFQFPTYQAFALSKNSIFRLNVGGEKVLELMLAEVSEQHLSAQQEQFSLLFRGPLHTFLPQSIYKLTHETGEVDIFLVPIGKDGEGYSYEAVFNILRQSS